MKICFDDASREWTQSGVFEVAPGIYRIPLPLPTDGLRAVNVYAVEDGEQLVLIDSGWAIASSRELLESALAALGRDLVRVSRFLVTHIHRDHYSQAVELRREFGSRVSLGAGERPSLDRLRTAGLDPLAAHYELLLRCGATALVEELRGAPGAAGGSIRWEEPDDWLADAQQIGLESHELQVVATPGHTRGHVVFVEERGALLFAGDHVLPHITPSVGFEPAVAELPLGSYLRSLALVRRQPDRRLLPAHGPVAASTHDRIDELLAHHEWRLEEMCRAVGDRGVSAYEVAQSLKWTRRDRRFEDLDAFNQMLAVIETDAHLALLVSQRRLDFSTDEGVRHYVLA